MSSSTFASSNRFVQGHSSGLNSRTWSDLRYSIASTLSHNLHGLAHSGSPVCGALGDARNDALCLNWIKLAAFQPLARFSYESSSQDNEPFLIKDPKMMQQAK